MLKDDRDQISVFIDMLARHGVLTDETARAIADEWSEHQAALYEDEFPGLSRVSTPPTRGND